VETIPEEKFDQIVSDFSKIIPRLKEKGIRLSGAFGWGSPVVNNNEIIFNGFGTNSCEAFYFPRVMESSILFPKLSNDKIFVFCKTHRLPYDLAVTSLLLILGHHLGKESIDIESNGDYNDWKDAIKLCQNELGYSVSDALTLHDDEGNNILVVDKVP
jgi:hypothetical protein